MYKKLIIEESEKIHIKNLYGLNEQEVSNPILLDLLKKALELSKNGDNDKPDLDNLSKTPLTKTTSDDDFYKKILDGVDAPVTPENMKFLYAWRQAEGGKAKNNPFNTTQPKPNSTFYNCLKQRNNGCVSGVRNYQTEQDGVDATIQTLKNGRYQGILNALKKGDSAIDVGMALKNSPWGTGELAIKVLKGYESGATPKPQDIA
jgi:hypothetical protein